MLTCSRGCSCLSSGVATSVAVCAPDLRYGRAVSEALFTYGLALSYACSPAAAVSHIEHRSHSCNGYLAMCAPAWHTARLSAHSECHPQPACLLSAQTSKVRTQAASHSAAQKVVHAACLDQLDSIGYCLVHCARRSTRGDGGHRGRQGERPVRCGCCSCQLKQLCHVLCTAKHCLTHWRRLCTATGCQAGLRASRCRHDRPLLLAAGVKARIPGVARVLVRDRRATALLGSAAHLGLLPMAAAPGCI